MFKKFEIMTSDHDLSQNCHMYSWLLFDPKFEQVKFAIDSKVFAHKQTLNNTFRFSSTASI